MKRYYYKKNGKAAYNLKEPLSNILKSTTGYEEITEQEWNELTSVSNHKPTSKEIRIRRLKHELTRTDYQAIKHSEGWISEEDYAPIKAQRQALRDEINELEESLK